MLAGALCLPSASAWAFPGLEDCVSESNPSFTVVTCDKHIGIENGRCVRCRVGWTGGLGSVGMGIDGR